MKKSTLVKTMLLLCALVVGSSSVWADNYTLQLSSEKKFYDSGLTDGYVEWSITNNDASIGSWSNSSNYNGQQFGTSSTTGNIVLSTSDINGTITKVEVTSQTGKNGGATVAVSVGGTSWGSNNMRVATGTGQTPGTLEFTHDGNGNGTVQITLTQTKKVAMYLNKIVITYTATKVATPKFSLAEGVYYGTQSVTINTLQNDVDIYYTTDGTDPTTSSTHYTEPVSISADATLKAIGVKDGLTNSEIASVPYAILTSYPAVTPKNYNTNYFVKVTDVNDLESGDAILMVNEAGGKVMTNQGSTYRNAADVTFSSEGVITSTPAKTEKIILVKTGNRYFFSTGAGYLYAASPTQNHLKSAEEATAGANGMASINIDNSGNASIVFLGDNSRNNLRFNSDRFCCYVSTGTQPLVQLYREIPGPAAGVEDGDELTLTTTDNMDGWRAFYDASQGYTLDANTKAYVATGKGTGTVTLTTIDAVPAGTPVVLKTSAADHKIILTKGTPSAYTGTNCLKVTTAGNAVDAYRLGYNSTDGVAFYPYAVASAPAGVIYLELPSGARALTFEFDDNTTAIEAVKTQKIANGEYFNLAGQRVAQPTKGLYIVNGKKVIIK